MVYNNGWIQSSAGGDAALALTRAQEVVNEAQKIYNDRYTSANRLGTSITFSLVGGGNYVSKVHSYVTFASFISII